MSEQERVDLLFQKIKNGVRQSFRKFLKEAQKNNRKLVSMRHGKVVLVPARMIK